MNDSFEQQTSQSPMTGKKSQLLFCEAVLRKYEARYFNDDEVGYIFAESPHWLDEAYSDAIAITDTGILARNVENINIIGRMLVNASIHFSQGIDLGGGYGLFVRGMRDAGFNFYWSDKYAMNLIARGFEAEPGKYDVAVAFEVLEHLTNPLAFLQQARLQYKFDTCFFSALCFDERNLPGKDWWYWSFETGQHISFFSERALHWMAAKLGMRLWPICGNIYAFSTLEWKQLTEGRLKRWWRHGRSYLDHLIGTEHRFGRNPLTFEDHIALRDKLRTASVPNERT